MGYLTKIRVLRMLSLLLVLVTGATAFAQEATPQAGSPQVIVENYLETRDANLLAEDVEFSDPVNMQPLTGRDAVTGTEDNLFGAQFGWNLEPYRYFYANTLVVVEFTYADDDANANTQNMQSAGMDVGIPMVAIFEVQDGQIISVRTYHDAAMLQNQLGLAGAFGVGADPEPNLENDPYAMLDAVTDDPGAHYGQTVTVAGPITEVIGAEGQVALIIVERDVLGDDPALIIPTSEDVFMNTGWATGDEIQVTGTVQQFDMSGIEDQIGRDLDDNLFAGYESYPVILAAEASVTSGNG